MKAPCEDECVEIKGQLLYKNYKKLTFKVSDVRFYSNVEENNIFYSKISCRNK
jgi:hypothetical protein